MRAAPRSARDSHFGVRGKSGNLDESTDGKAASTARRSVSSSSRSFTCGSKHFGGRSRRVSSASRGAGGRAKRVLGRSRAVESRSMARAGGRRAGAGGRDDAPGRRSEGLRRREGGRAPVKPPTQKNTVAATRDHPAMRPRAAPVSSPASVFRFNPNAFSGIRAEACPGGTSDNSPAFQRWVGPKRKQIGRASCRERV